MTPPGTLENVPESEMTAEAKAKLDEIRKKYSTGINALASRIINPGPFIQEEFEAWLRKMKNYNPIIESPDIWNQTNLLPGKELVEYLMKIRELSEASLIAGDVHVIGDMQHLLSSCPEIWNQIVVFRQGVTLSQHTLAVITALHRFLITDNSQENKDKNTILYLTAFLHDIGKPSAISEVITHLTRADREKFTFINPDNSIDLLILRDWELDRTNEHQQKILNEWKNKLKAAEERHTQEIVHRILPTISSALGKKGFTGLDRDLMKTQKLILELVKFNPLGDFVFNINSINKSDKIDEDKTALIENEKNNLITSLTESANQVGMPVKEYFEYIHMMYFSDVLAYTSSVPIPTDMVQNGHASTMSKAQEIFGLNWLVQESSVTPGAGCENIKFENSKINEILNEIQTEFENGESPKTTN